MTTTLRMDESLADQVRLTAKHEGASINEFIVTAIQHFLDVKKEEEWRRGFEAMADDPEACDVEYAFAAQAEVVLNNE